MGFRRNIVLNLPNSSLTLHPAGPSPTKESHRLFLEIYGLQSYIFFSINFSSRYKYLLFFYSLRNLLGGEVMWRRINKFEENMNQSKLC